MAAQAVVQPIRHDAAVAVTQNQNLLRFRSALCRVVKTEASVLPLAAMRHEAISACDGRSGFLTLRQRRRRVEEIQGVHREVRAWYRLDARACRERGVGVLPEQFRGRVGCEGLGWIEGCTMGRCAPLITDVQRHRLGKQRFAERVRPSAVFLVKGLVILDG